MISGQIPHDSDRPEMILFTQVENFFFNLIWCFIRGVYRYGLFVFEPVFTGFLIPFYLSIECRPAHAKIPAGLSGITALLGVMNDL